MTELPIPESVWWYVLAGFLLGFILSTLWEWLYFRSRRLRIENRRIAELEARVRSLTPPAGAADSAIAPGAPPPYQGPGVFLESEQSQNTTEVVTTSTTTGTTISTTTGAAAGAASETRSMQFAAAAEPPAPAQPAAQAAAPSAAPR